MEQETTHAIPKFYSNPQGTGLRIKPQRVQSGKLRFSAFLFFIFRPFSREEDFAGNGNIPRPQAGASQSIQAKPSQANPASHTGANELRPTKRRQKEKKKSGQLFRIARFGSGRRTRTSDLRVMSPTSCQLLHPAICLRCVIYRFCKCKGNTNIRSLQIKFYAPRPPR